VHAGGVAGLTRLRKRVFELSLEYGASCGCEVKNLAAILAQPVVEKSLTHRDLQTPPCELGTHLLLRQLCG
jgi:hypothetical protein